MLDIKDKARPTHPIAYVRQSAAGARAVTAIWSMVLAEMCSDVAGSKRMMFPWVFPGLGKLEDFVMLPVGSGQDTYRRQHCHFASRQRLLSARRKQIGQPHRPSSNPTL